MTCPFGDLLCPCPDGDACHYEGPDPMPPPVGWQPERRADISDDGLYRSPLSRFATM